VGRFLLGKYTHDTPRPGPRQLSPHKLTLDDLHHGLGLAFFPHGSVVETEAPHTA